MGRNTSIIHQMTHRFPIKELALQAGLSTATVDRALNDRPHVSPQTKARIAAAIEELKTQESQLAARGRRMFIDIIVEAPARFSRELKSACEEIIPNFGPAVFRPRFFLKEFMTETETLELLSTIKKRGSSGVILKVRDLAKIRQAVSDLESRNIPVVTIVTDLPNSGRSAYVGLDNESAGRTAGYIMGKSLIGKSGHVLTTASQSTFFGENERLAGFKNVIQANNSNIKFVHIAGGGGRLSNNAAEQIEHSLFGVKQLHGVYSMGGGNKAILKALDKCGIKPGFFIAHDLDEDNCDLLKQYKITAALFHDLRQDLRSAFSVIATQHHLMPPNGLPLTSDILVITPMNIPFRYR